MPKIKINDINMYYEERGQGEPLVLIGGFCADHFAWMSVASLFAQNYRVILCDNRGAGQSDCPDFPYTMQMLADDIVALCKQLNISQAHFLGNSMGGHIVQTLAYRYPELTCSAVISNSSAKMNVRAKLGVESRLPLLSLPVPPSAIMKSVLAQLYSIDFLSRQGMVDDLVNVMLANPYPTTEVGYRNQMHALLEFDSVSWLEKITAPTLVVYSDDDALVDLDSSQLLCSKIPNAEAYCFQRVGHLPHIEKPAEFYQVVRAFLEKQ